MILVFVKVNETNKEIKLRTIRIKIIEIKITSLENDVLLRQGFEPWSFSYFKIRNEDEEDISFMHSCVGVKENFNKIHCKDRIKFLCIHFIIFVSI